MSDSRTHNHTCADCGQSWTCNRYVCMPHDKGVVIAKMCITCARLAAILKEVTCLILERKGFK